MACVCQFDFKLAKDYLAVLLSFPPIILLLVGGFGVYYRREIRALIPRIKKFGKDGVEVDPEQTALTVVADLRETDEIQRPLKEAIERMEDGPIKEEIKRLQEEEANATQLRTIAASLREQLVYKTTPMTTRDHFNPTAADVEKLSKIMRTYLDGQLGMRPASSVAELSRADSDMFFRMSTLVFEAQVEEYGIRCYRQAFEKAIADYYADPNRWVMNAPGA